MELIRQARALIAWRRHLRARRLGSSEGCSFVPDFDFVDCCRAHDEEYETHLDAQTQEPITRAESDEKLYLCIAFHHPVPHPHLAYVYWWWVRALGWASWNAAVFSVRLRRLLP